MSSNKSVMILIIYFLFTIFCVIVSFINQTTRISSQNIINFFNQFIISNLVNNFIFLPHQHLQHLLIQNLLQNVSNLIQLLKWSHVTISFLSIQLLEESIGLFFCFILYGFTFGKPLLPIELILQDVTISRISLSSSFEITSVVMRDPYFFFFFFFWTSAAVANASVVTPNGSKTFSTNDLIN